MRIYWIWLILSIGGVLDLTLITWNFPVKRGRVILAIFYGILLPLCSGQKTYLIFQGKSYDALFLSLLLVLILGTWRITGVKFGEILIAFAFVCVGGAGSELIALGVIYSILGIPVLPMDKAEGSMACMMLANGLMLFYLMGVNGFWKRYGQGKRVNRDFLLFFLVLVQTIFLYWIAYAGYQGYINITFGLLAGVVIIVFGTMSFSFIQIYDEETREEEKKLKRMELQVQREFVRFQELEEKERMLDQIRHDFNNHLSMVYYLSREGKMDQAEQLLDEMEQTLCDKGEDEASEKKTVVETERQTAEKVLVKFKGLWIRQLFLVPAGQLLLLPAVGQILAVHLKSWWLLADGIVFFLMVGTDGLWLVLLFKQRRREKRNEQLLADIYEQQAQQSREKILQEGRQERKELQKDLLSCLKDAKDKVELQKEPSALNNVLREMQKREKSRYCDNELVNMVLEEKLRECREFQIPVLVQVEVPKVLEVKSSHLCSVWTNLLDNGIHACKSLSPARRWMHIQSKKQGDYLYIRVSNSTSVDYGRRPSAPGHGLGKQILARLAVQYQGEYWTKVSDETYIATVVMQIHRKSKMTSNE